MTIAQFQFLIIGTNEGWIKGNNDEKKERDSTRIFIKNGASCRFSETGFWEF